MKLRQCLLVAHKQLMSAQAAANPLDFMNLELQAREEEERRVQGS